MNITGDVFLTAEKFHKMVVDVVRSDNIPYLEAVMHICDVTDINPEDLVKNKLISPNLKESIRLEGVDMGVLIKESTLPL